MKSFIVCAFVVTSALSLTGCGGAPEHAGSPTEKKTGATRLTLTSQSIKDIELEIATAEMRSLKKELVFPAKLTVHQDNEAQVGTLVQGRVSKVLVNPGDRVQRGQELMQIEGVEIGEIKAGFIKAKAQLTYAEGALKRQKALVDENIGAQKSFLEAQSEYEKARAEFAAEDQRIHSIGLTDEDVEKSVEHSMMLSVDSHVGGTLPVKSPIAGVVVERNVVMGQLVDPSTTAFKVVNTSVLWVDGLVHEGDVNAVKGNPEITIVVPSIPKGVFRARLLYVGEIVDQQTRMVKVRATVSNALHNLKPDMFAEMHIPTGGERRGVVLSAECIIADGAEHFVFVSVNDTTFEKRNVIPGLEMGEFVEVKDGIRQGEKVVAKGAFMLKSELKKSTFGEGD